MEKIKCLIWDLDNTLWEGILSEDKSVVLINEACKVVKELDERGILQSIASKNDFSTAWDKLKDFSLDEYFIYPQIHWGNKSDSIKHIAEQINIGINTVAFIDDQAFERDEVLFTHPEVRCFAAENVSSLLINTDFIPTYITSDSAKRREMYQHDIQRKKDEDLFDGSSEEFLNTLQMELTITRATESDLRRVEELTIRTHQLNSTGYIYNYEELCQFIKSDNHRLYVIGLEDKYGDYGKIGIVLLELQNSIWMIRLFLLSCRVVSKGIGNVVLQYIARLAYEARCELKAEFIHNEKNRMMYLTFMLNGFTEQIDKEKTVLCYENKDIYKEFPSYIKKLIQN